jgi:hypothetical protein
MNSDVKRITILSPLKDYENHKYVQMREALYYLYPPSFTVLTNQCLRQNFKISVPPPTRGVYAIKLVKHCDNIIKVNTTI